MSELPVPVAGLVNVTNAPMYSDSELRAACMKAAQKERKRLSEVISPAQFRTLAAWFDDDDAYKMMMYSKEPDKFPETWKSRGNEVQQDLRRFADLLERIVRNEREPGEPQAAAAD